MKRSKLKLESLKVKSFTTNTKSDFEKKSRGTDGGYTWVG